MKTQRRIPLLLEHATPKDLERLEQCCVNRQLTYEYRYARRTPYVTYTPEPGEIIPLYYFYLIGDTKAFQDLQSDMKGRLQLCEHAKIGNIADQDDTFTSELVQCLELMKKASRTTEHASATFVTFIMKIKNLDVLLELKQYICYMTEHQQRCLQARIDILSNKQEVLDEQFTEDILSLHTDIKTLRAEHHMNRTQFCEYFGIPYRTVEDWENGKSTCSTYLYKLIKEKLQRNI